MRTGIIHYRRGVMKCVVTTCWVMSRFFCNLTPCDDKYNDQFFLLSKTNNSWMKMIALYGSLALNIEDMLILVVAIICHLQKQNFIQHIFLFKHLHFFRLQIVKGIWGGCTPKLGKVKLWDGMSEKGKCEFSAADRLLKVSTGDSTWFRSKELLLELTTHEHKLIGQSWTVKIGWFWWDSPTHS